MLFSGYAIPGVMPGQRTVEVSPGASANCLSGTGNGKVASPPSNPVDDMIIQPAVITSQRREARCERAVERALPEAMSRPSPTRPPASASAFAGRQPHSSKQKAAAVDESLRAQDVGEDSVIEQSAPHSQGLKPATMENALDPEPDEEDKDGASVETDVVLRGDELCSVCQKPLLANPGERQHKFGFYYGMRRWMGKPSCNACGAFFAHHTRKRRRLHLGIARPDAHAADLANHASPCGLVGCVQCVERRYDNCLKVGMRPDLVKPLGASPRPESQTLQPITSCLLAS